MEERWKETKVGRGRRERMENSERNISAADSLTFKGLFPYTIIGKRSEPTYSCLNEGIFLYTSFIYYVVTLAAALHLP